jgi:hypothetical protein
MNKLVHRPIYKALFECPKGHRFSADVDPGSSDGSMACPTCYAEWVAANVPSARQIGPAVLDDKGHFALL